MVARAQAWAWLIAGLLAGGCTKSPDRSPETVVDTAVAAVQAGDVDGYVASMLTLAELRSRCPVLVRDFGEAKIAEELGLERTKVAPALAGCADVAWASARRLRVVGGDPREAAVGCDGVTRLGDIHVVFAVGGGEVVVTLDDPIAADGWLAFTGVPRCRFSPEDASGGLP